MVLPYDLGRFDAMVSAHEKEALEYLSGFVPGMLPSSFTQGDVKGRSGLILSKSNANVTASQSVLSSTVLPCHSCNIFVSKCEED